MASIKNMEIGEAVSSHPRVEVRKALLGLKTVYYYSPTGSVIEGEKFDVSAETGGRLIDALRTDAGQRGEALRGMGKLGRENLGNMHVECCRSADGQFVAVQVFAFSSLSLHPQMPVMVLEGKEAQDVAAVI